MPIFVEFVKHAMCPTEVKQRCGPYRLAEVSGTQLNAFEMFMPLVIATRTPAGRWIVNGLDGM